MPLFSDNPVFRFIGRYRGLLFPIAAAALIFVILIPLPTWVLDVLLVANIALTTVVLMTVMYLRSPLEFSSFPSLLLAMTLLRLVLNTATTRLILSNGMNGTQAAGKVVEAFGVFVASNSLAVGVIIFLIITVIQFVVITKGATRIAEVAARFTLDGMPGKQMAIDADLNAGIIDEAEARRRRKEIAQEADFYGAMDGASKFVRGDAIAGIIITFVNVLGGLYVGLVEHGMGIWQSLDVYTKLTIGDGLAAQIPAFLLSVGAGLLVTRSTGQTNMGEEVIGQLLAKPVALIMSAGFLFLLALTPLPTLPLVTLGAACTLLALVLSRQSAAEASRKQADERAKARAQPEKIEAQLRVDPIELHIGLALVRLVDRGRGGDLLDRVSSLRRQMAQELGLVVPPIRIRDQGTLEAHAYTVLLRGEAIAGASVYPDQLLAIDSGLVSEPIGGLPTREPAFGLEAWWIAPAERDRAERLNYTVAEPTSVIATHLTELIKRHAPELLTRAELNKLIDHLKQHNAPLVEEVIPALLKPGDVQRVLQNLLRERVPIRDLETIFEAIGDCAARTKDPDILSEYARNALSRTLCSQYRDAQNALHCVTLDPALEDVLRASLAPNQAANLLLPPELQGQLLLKIRQQVEQAGGRAGGAPLAILCGPQIRLALRRLVEQILPATPVLALNEIVRGVEIRAHGVIALDAKRTDHPSLVHA